MFPSWRVAFPCGWSADSWKFLYKVPCSDSLGMQEYVMLELGRLTCIAVTVYVLVLPVYMGVYAQSPLSVLYLIYI